MGGNNSKLDDSLGDSKKQIECSQPTRVPSANDVNPPSTRRKEFDKRNSLLVKYKKESSEKNQ